jgi:hypothetical protein
MIKAMTVDEIRKFVKVRPFRMFEIHIDNGEKFLITHPENIFVTNTIIVTVDDNGDSIFITPESVSTIRQIAEQPTQT